MARVFKRGKVWYAWVPKPEGGTRKASTNCTDEKAAHARAAELERESLDPDGAAAKKATLRDALDLLIRDRSGKAKAGKGSVETVGFYRRKSGVLLDGLAEVLRRSPKAAVFIHEVKPGLVDDYIAQRRDDGAKDSSIAKELTTWRAAMRIAKRRRWFRLDIDEVFPVGFSSGSKARERWVTPEEFSKLYEAMVRPTPIRRPDLAPERIAELRARRRSGENLRSLANAFGISYPTATRLCRRDAEPEPGPSQGHALFAIVCFSIATSAEWSAIWRARRGDIAADLATVRVRGSKNDARDRPVPIAMLPFTMLLDFAVRHGDGELADQEGAFLFRGSHASSFRHRLREACKRAGIPSLSPNDLRRTHAKWLRLAGVAPATIAPSMGHKDARMVERVYGKSSAIELAGVQRAQLAVGGGLLMGGAGPKSTNEDTPRRPAETSNRRDSSCPGTESNRRHGDFQSPAGSQDAPGEMPLSPTSWAANGQLDSSARTIVANPEGGEGSTSSPPSRSGTPVLDRDGDGPGHRDSNPGNISGRNTTSRDVTPGQAQDAPADGVDDDGSRGPRTPGPGPARARPTVDVDGRDVDPKEELADVGAVFPFAGGRRP